jgi:O-acetyl-ADP-ribose deacetylase (regulator of RNase III)
MTIRYSTGDIFASGADAIVIPTNAVGTQGAGLAKQAAQRWPSWSREYRRVCKSALGVVPGGVWPYRVVARWLLAFATKDHWRNPSQIEWIEHGLMMLDYVVTNDLDPAPKSIAIPALGCGYGGLAWEDVRPLIERAAERMPGVDVLVYPPQEARRK